MSKHNTPSDFGSKMGLDDTIAGVVVIEMPGGHIARNQGRTLQPGILDQCRKGLRLVKSPELTDSIPH